MRTSARPASPLLSSPYATLFVALPLSLLLVVWCWRSWADHVDEVSHKVVHVARLQTTALALAARDARRAAAAIDDALRAPGAPTARRDIAPLLRRELAARFGPGGADAVLYGADGVAIAAASSDPADAASLRDLVPALQGDGAPPPGFMPVATLAGVAGLPYLHRRADGSSIVVHVPTAGLLRDASPHDRAIADFSALVDDAGHLLLYQPHGPGDPPSVHDGAPGPRTGTAVERRVRAWAADRLSMAGERPDRGRVGRGWDSDLLGWVEVPGTGLQIVSAVPWRRVVGHWLRDSGWLFLLTAGLVGASTAASLATIRRLRAEQALMRRLQRRYDVAVRQAGIGVWEHRCEDGEFHRNAVLADWVGAKVAAPALDCAAVAGLLHPDDREAFGAAYRRALADPSTSDWQSQVRLASPGGTWRWVRVTCSFERTDVGRARKAIGTATDISAEHEVTQARREQALAQARDRARSEFLSRASHELRTPLNGMVGLAQIVAAQMPRDSEQRAHLRRIEQAGWHLVSLIDDLLDLSRLEAGRMRLSLETVRLADLLDQVVVLMQPQAVTRGISLVVEPTGLAAHGDRTRLLQVMQNLLSNAVKYNRDGGSVRLAADLTGGEVAISVTDTGIGLSPPDVARLYEPFNRLGREHTAVPGAGLGLAISRSFIEAMGGRMAVESAEGVGTTFRVWLPAAGAAAAPPALASSQPVRRSLPAPSIRTVLVVEDDDVNALCLAEAIRLMRPQWVVHRARSLAEADVGVVAFGPDLVFLDLNLPDGHALHHLATAGGALATLDRQRVVVLSADVQATTRQTCTAQGIARVLGKPFALTAVGDVLDAVGARGD